MSQEIEQIVVAPEATTITDEKSDDQTPEVATKIEEIIQEMTEVAITTTNGNATAEEQQQNHESIGSKIRRTSEKIHSLEEGTDFKRYTKDDLMKLKTSAISRQQPTTIPDVCRGILRSSNPGSGYASKNFNQDNSLLPSFMKNMGFGGGGGGVPGSNRPYKGRSSLKREPNTPDETDGTKNIIKIPLNVNEVVKLKESANAWRPRHLLKSDAVDPEDQKTQELFKKFRSCMNKLTPENFTKLVEQVKGFTIDTEDRLDGCIKLVFEKAISEPCFTDTYAQMCKELGTAIILGTNEQKLNFKRKLVTQCQKEFEEHQQDKDRNLKKQEENQMSSMSAEEMEEKRLELEDQDVKIRRRALGTIRFIGELYRNEQLTPNIMHKCITILLNEKVLEEESLECLCKLLTTIGAKIEKEGGQDLSYYFVKLQEIYDRKKVSNRIRFMILDLIDLRRNAWQPRRVELKQKTMDEIQQEAEAEENRNKLLNFALPRSKNDTDSQNRGGQYNNYQSGQDNSGSAQKNKRFVDDEGFVQPAQTARGNRNIPMIDPKKINIPLKSSEQTKLGSASVFQSFTNTFASLNEESSTSPSSYSGSNQQTSNSNSSSNNNSNKPGYGGGGGGGGGGSSGGGGGNKNKSGNNNNKQFYQGRKSSRF